MVHVPGKGLIYHEAWSRKQPSFHYMAGGVALVGELGQDLVLGHSFAFLRNGWDESPTIASVLGAAGLDEPIGPRIFSMWGHGAVTLPGVRVQRRQIPRRGLASLWTDRPRYLEQQDTVRVVIFDPIAKGKEITLRLFESGHKVGEQPVSVDEFGIGLTALQGLPAGHYQLRLGKEGPRAGFEVARPRVELLSASLVQQYQQPIKQGGLLVFVAKLEAFGVPFQGEVGVNLIDEGQEPARPMTGNIFRADGGGRVAGELPILGDGPFSLEFQSIAEPERRCFLSLSKPQEGEPESPFVINPLGMTQVWRWDGGRAEPGLGFESAYLPEDGESPVLLESVGVDEVILQALQPLEQVMVVILDPARGVAHTHTWPKLDVEGPVTLKIPSPLGVVCLGGFLEGRPWEGWATVVAVEPKGLRLQAPTSLRPGDTLKLDIETGEDALVPVFVRILEDEDEPAQWGPADSLKGCLAEVLQGMRLGVQEEALLQVLGQKRGALGPEEEEEAAPFPDGWRPPVPSAEHFGSLLYAGLVPVQSKATLDVPLGDTQASYRIEALRLDGLSWRYASRSLDVQMPSFVEINVPEMAHTDDAIACELMVITDQPEVHVALWCDEEEVSLWLEGREISGAVTLRGPSHQLHFAAKPGHYRASLADASGQIVDTVEAEILPWAQRRAPRKSILWMPEGASFSRHEAGMQEVYPFLGPGWMLEQVCEVMLNQPSGNCAEEAARLRAAACLALRAEDPRVAQKAQQTALETFSRLRQLYMPERGFLSQPKGPLVPELAEEAVLLLWETLLWSGDGPWRADLQGLVEKAARALQMEALPNRIRGCRDAFRVFCLDSSPIRRQEAVWEVEKRLGEQPAIFADDRGRVLHRVETAFAGALLLASEDRHHQMRGLQLANILTRDLQDDFSFPSMRDNGALLSLLASLERWWTPAEESALELNQQICDVVEAPIEQIVDTLKILKGTASLVAQRIVEISLKDFPQEIPWEVQFTSVQAGLREEAYEVEQGARITLVVSLPQGATSGDILEVFLPPALVGLESSLEQKSLSFPFQGKSRLEIPILAAKPTLQPSGEIGGQHWGIRLHNPMQPERGAAMFHRLITVWPPGSRRRRKQSAWMGGFRRKLFG
ncbi:MAG: hypothetical protein H6727_08880 [Myxococcales bacterium]|nr:hypothetical protein [Myxococcales bacterium]